MTRLVSPGIATVLLVGVVAASVAGVAACSSSGAEVVRGNKAAAETAEIDRNDILDDAAMQDDESMTETEVQAFLERTPYGARSVLASYQPKGKRASTILVETARQYGINPMVLLVRLQLEQGLVSKKTATDRELDRAFGCGCSDTKASTAGDAASSHTCSPDLTGFENQARCAASTLRRAMDALAGSTGVTRSGWAKGKAKKTLDGIVVTPKNRATAALYGYTPWVGKLGGGKASVGGNSAHRRLWLDFEEARTAGSGGKDASRADGGASAPDTEDPEATGGEEIPASGCRVTDGEDSCPAGSRCDRSDGLVGTCVASTCACGEGTFCDSTANPPKCVECTAKDTSSCHAEGAGDRCVQGQCGCLTSADCGFDRRRICDPTRGVCMDDPFPQRGPDAGAADAGGAEPTTDLPGGTEGSEPPPSTPRLPSGDEGDEGESGSGGKSKDDSEEELTLPKSDQASSGCAASGKNATGAGTATLLAVVAAALAGIRRRSACSKSVGERS